MYIKAWKLALHFLANLFEAIFTNTVNLHVNFIRRLIVQTLAHEKLVHWTWASNRHHSSKTNEINLYLIVQLSTGTLQNISLGSPPQSS